MSDSNQAGQTPRPVEGVDMRSLPIGPEEAFVLSRIDGRSEVADIAAATGLDTDTVRGAVNRLAELGAVLIGAPEPEPERLKETNNRVVAEAAKMRRPAVEAPAEERSTTHPAAALYDPSELDEEIELDLTRKRMVLDQFYRLDSLSHYELLEIETDADKKTIKNAYFRVVAIYHPDKYFGKKLGSFKEKLELVFKRVTEAHDTLTRKKTREEYDAYLSTRRQTSALDRAMHGGQDHAAELERIRRQIEEQARMEERIVRPTGPPRVSRPPPPLDPEARKKALARKLRASSNAPKKATVSDAEKTRTKVAAQEKIKGDFKRRHEERMVTMSDRQIEKYIAAADEAEKNRDKISAANALRIATTLAPDDESLKQRYESLHNDVNAELADSYFKAAEYEERQRRFAEAAASYQKALRGRKTKRGYERAAHCILEAGGDLREAADLAKKAVGLSADWPDARITLARIYLSLDLRKSALGELERAAKSAPKDDRVKDWVKRIKRGEV